MGRVRRIPARGDVPEWAVAQVLGLTVADFQARTAELRDRGFPEPDPTTGLYCIEAVDRWRLRRHAALFPELTTAPAAAHAEAVFGDRLRRFNGEDQNFLLHGDCGSRLFATNSQKALARVSDRPLRCRRSPGLGAFRRMEQTVAVGPQARGPAARKSRQALARSGGSRTTLPARLNRRGLSSLYRHTRVGRPRPVEPRQDLVAGMVSHSGYVGRCRTGY